MILDLEGRKVLGLNPVGSVVWGLMDGQRTVREISREVAARFGVDEARARADVEVFLSTLATRGLVEV